MPYSIVYVFVIIVFHLAYDFGGESIMNGFVIELRRIYFAFDEIWRAETDMQLLLQHFPDFW